MSKRPFFFFHQLGYRRNPFGALSEEEWEQIAVLPAAVKEALSRPHHLQLIGPKGVGKSTTLRGIVRQLRADGRRVAYEYLPQGQHHYKTPLANLDIFCLDEGQRLSWREQWRLWRAAPRLRLILGTHRQLRPFVLRQPLLTISLAHLIDAAHWRATLQRRLAYFALPDTSSAALTDPAINWLCEKYAGDLRAGEYFLYEVWQRLEEKRPVTVKMLEESGT